MNEDLSEFLPYLTNTNLNDEEKLDVLRTLWQMIEAQVDVAFGVHPVQLACEQKEKRHLRKHKDSLDSNTYPISLNHRHAANDEFPLDQKGGQNNASGQ